MNLFLTDTDDALHPTVTGGSAGLNSVMFFSCPECGACVVDMYFDATNRNRHNEWHEKLKELLNG